MLEGGALKRPPISRVAQSLRRSVVPSLRRSVAPLRTLKTAELKPKTSGLKPKSAAELTPKNPELKTPELKTPELKTPALQTPALNTLVLKTPALKTQSKAQAPELEWTEISAQSKGKTAKTPEPKVQAKDQDCRAKAQEVTRNSIPI